MKRILILSAFLCLSALTACSNNHSDEPFFDESKKITLTSVKHKETVSLINDDVKQYLDGTKNIDEFKNVKADYQKDILLSWEDDLSYSSYEVKVSTNIDLKDSTIYTIKDAKSLTITNLLLDQKYYWKVTSLDYSNYDSNIGMFFTEKNPPRFLKVDGINNVRDLGGWTTLDNKIVKQGLIYRGSEMNNNFNITEEGKKYLNEELKIKTDIDLRTDREALDITSSPLGDNVNYLHISEFEGYNKVIYQDQKENYLQLFKALSKKESYPIYLHCYQGADRTGTACAILEALLGLDEKDIAKEYELTTFANTDFIRKSSEKYSFIFKNITMLYKEDSLKKSVEKYLKEFVGLTQEEIDSIRSILLEN